MAENLDEDSEGEEADEKTKKDPESLDFHIESNFNKTAGPMLKNPYADSNVEEDDEKNKKNSESIEPATMTNYGPMLKNPEADSKGVEDESKIKKTSEIEPAASKIAGVLLKRLVRPAFFSISYDHRVNQLAKTLNFKIFAHWWGNLFTHSIMSSVLTPNNTSTGSGIYAPVPYSALPKRALRVPSRPLSPHHTSSRSGSSSSSRKREFIAIAPNVAARRYYNIQKGFKSLMKILYEMPMQDVIDILKRSLFEV